MAVLQRTWACVTTLLPARMAFFLAFLAAYIHFVVDERLIYTQQAAGGPILLANLHTLWNSLNAPGDAAEWVSQWLTQYYFFGLPGVAIIVASAWCILRCTVVFNRAMARAGIGGAWAIPAILLVLLHSQYDYPLSGTLGVLAAIGLTAIYVRLPAGGTAVRLAAFASAAAALYAFAGGASLLFTINAAIYELLVARRTVTAIVVAVGGAAIAMLMGPLAPWQALSPALAIDATLLGRHVELTFGQFYVTAGGAAIVLAALAAICDSLNRRVPATALALVATAVVACMMLIGPLTAFRPDSWPIAQALAETGKRLLPYLEHSDKLVATVLMALYVYFPAMAMLLAFRGGILRVADRVSRAMSSEGSWAASGLGAAAVAILEAVASVRSVPVRAREETPYGVTTNVAIVLAQSLVLVCVGLGAGLLSLDRGSRAAIKVDYCADAERWDDVLRTAKDVPRSKYTYATAQAVNLALYHTGRMGQDMFAYPQGFPLIAGLFDISEMSALVRTSDILMELGRVNEAEAMAGSQHTAAAIKRLAMARIIKGQVPSAKVCLNVLSNDVVHGAWARDCLRRLDADPLLSGDRSVMHIRSLMPEAKNDDLNTLYIKDVRGAESMLLRQLEADKQHHNRMAFEFLMAGRLIGRRLDAFCADLPRLDDFRGNDGRPFYTGIPRHYEEAMLMHFHLTGKRTVLPGRQISDDTVRRWERFKTGLKTYGSDTPDGAAAMEAEFGDSYFYFCYYGRAHNASGMPIASED